MKNAETSVQTISSNKRLLAVACLAALAGVPVAAHAADVTLNASNTAGTTSFASNLSWSDGLTPAAGNNYIVPTGFSLRTPFDSTDNLTFAGDSLQLNGTTASNAVLVIKNANGTTTTINNFTLNGGQIQNGGTSTGAATAQTVVSNLITVGANGGVINAGASGRTLTISAPIALGGALTVNATGGAAYVDGIVSGTGNVTLNNGGNYVSFTGANTYTGNTTISGSYLNGYVYGAVRASDGTNISSAGSLTLSSGVLDISTNITRALGTDAGQISIVGAASGFSAVGSAVTVSIGGTASPTPLTWGSATFNPTALVLADWNANNTLTFANDIDLGGATRYIFAAASNTATQSVLGGALTGTGSVQFYGNSTIVLTKASTYTGTTTIGQWLTSSQSSPQGIVRVAASNALSTGDVTIGLGGNGVTSRLELTNGVTLPNNIVLPSRNVADVAIRNVSGDNTLSGTIGITSGGSQNNIESVAGTLTLSGTTGSGVALQSLLGSRTVTFGGAGNGVISGIIRDNNGTAGPTIAITKTGAGTWTLTGTNSYTGATTVSAGTLALGNGGTFGSASVTNNATVGFSNTTALSVPTVITGTGGVLKTGAGTTVVTGANTYTGTTVVQAGTLNLTNAAQSPVLTGAGGADVQGGKLVLDYTGGSSPVASVKSILDAGYAGNFATGQIKGTTLAANRTLGYGDSGTAVTIRVTLAGDADLDGDVDFNDFLVLQSKFGQANTRFDEANFNYDGFTDFNDFLALQANFGQSVTGDEVAFTSAQVAAMTAFASVVPEPASLTLIGMGAAGLLGRRRRSR
ncbi:MAG: autotransporter-associated beta strand repeat-containing protein [Tepidisphaeraceae bacterium]